jgi:hypothetical protein
MKKHLFTVILLTILAIFPAKANKPELSVQVGHNLELRAAETLADETVYVIRGNDDSLSFFVTASGLSPQQVITIKVPGEFIANQTELPYNANHEEVVVKLRATKPVSEGDIYICVGTLVQSYHVVGYASSLPEKDLSINPVYSNGDDAAFSISDAEGFIPSEKGFTLEVSAKLPAAISYINPFAITTQGVGFQSSINRDAFLLRNSTVNNKTLVDKTAQSQGGSGIFYPDDEYHVYRFAVAADNRVHIYRDGLLVDYMRTGDFGLQPSFQDGPGDMEENLLVNGDFEGEYEYITEDPESQILGALEGWNIATESRWNSEQFIVKEVINQELGLTNHVLKVNRYMWSNGYNAAEYGQIVDVVPGQTYTFSALAKGGYSSRVGSYLGSLRIQEVKGVQLINEKTVDITSDDWQEYSLDYTPSASATQIRALIYLERGDTWSETAAMYIDNAKLTGQRAAYQQQIGFNSRIAEIEYFNFDATGAYAPLKKEIALSVNKIAINGTNNIAILTVTPKNINKSISLRATSGFSVSPEEIPAGSGATEVTVTYKSSLEKTSGKLILRSDMLYAYADLTGTGTPLPEKDLSVNPVYSNGDDAAFSISDAEGFTPGDKGYTIEVSAKPLAAISYINPFAITNEGVGFQGFIQREAIGVSNSTLGWNRLFINPLSLNNKFYPDDEFHTLRYSVTPDKRIFVYRDGNLLDIVHTHDFGLQPSFQDGAGDYEENLLVNGDFEGEYSYIADDPDSKILATLEGWHIAVDSRWNSEQYIETQEIGKEYDFNNHVLKVNRFAWENGWNAAEYGQIIGVVPGQTYTFSALAKGGYSSRVGGYLGSLRVQEVKGVQLINEKTVDITSDDWQEYSLDYTPSASATQIRALIYLERGDTWSESADMYIDNAKLSGQRAAYQQQIGFNSRIAEIKYFNFDATGAYAPPFSGFTVEPPVGINNISDNKEITASVRSGVLYLSNVPSSSVVSIYNASGSLVGKTGVYSGAGIRLPQKGFYVAIVKADGRIRSLKVVY